MIKISYLPLDSLKLLDRNPKKHEIDKLIASFQKYGFRDAPILDDIYDNIVAGNGRISALRQMKKEGLPAPLGIIEKDGEWLVPLQTGTGSVSPSEALSFAIDHNNITLMGGDFNVAEIAKLWTPEYISLLIDLGKAGNFPVSVDADNLDILINYSGLIPGHIAREAENMDEHEAVTVIVGSVEHFPAIMEKIHKLVDGNPQWQAKIR